jgi:hypothetical protein
MKMKHEERDLAVVDDALVSCAGTRARALRAQAYTAAAPTLS